MVVLKFKSSSYFILNIHIPYILYYIYIKPTPITVILLDLFECLLHIINSFETVLYINILRFFFLILISSLLVCFLIFKMY